MKPPYTFISRDDSGNIISIRHAYSFTWTELFDEFREFLNGCGFTVPCGEIMIKENED